MTHPSIEPRSTGKDHAGVISLRLRDARQLFNSMDPSPFPDRDLDQDAEEFIVGWAKEFASHVPLVLRLHFEPTADRHLANTVEEAVNNFFDYRAQVTRRKFRNLLSNGRKGLLIGGVFLALCLGAANQMGLWGDTPLHQILSESFIIVGWVAMWRPIDTFLYEWWPIRHEWRVYQRLSQARVEIVFTPPPTTPTIVMP